MGRDISQVEAGRQPRELRAGKAGSANCATSPNSPNSTKSAWGDKRCKEQRAKLKEKARANPAALASSAGTTVPGNHWKGERWKLDDDQEWRRVLDQTKAHLEAELHLIQHTPEPLDETHFLSSLESAAIEEAAVKPKRVARELRRLQLQLQEAAAQQQAATCRAVAENFRKLALLRGQVFRSQYFRDEASVKAKVAHLEEHISRCCDEWQAWKKRWANVCAPSESETAVSTSARRRKEEEEWGQRLVTQSQLTTRVKLELHEARNFQSAQLQHCREVLVELQTADAPSSTAEEAEEELQARARQLEEECRERLARLEEERSATAAKLEERHAAVAAKRSENLAQGLHSQPAAASDRPPLQLLKTSGVQSEAQKVASLGSALERFASERKASAMARSLADQQGCPKCDV
ncbi:hypothetical protein CYMTET_12004 [Cymbomonas tetramitiformis]|uniref:Uncharacterized protein n=1 Tax=Cymbomonas tetramitiformis TaxID=36881 RepID=A0AAE0GLK0_9CHLO|nr:hypothetical protein CYMTET_12004 [Cymbomonas tetramitiformis]